MRIESDDWVTGGTVKRRRMISVVIYAQILERVDYHFAFLDRKSVV